MGCTSCKSKTGCDHRKGEMFASVDRALARLYPTRTWGEPVDDADLDVVDLDALADELADVLRAATFVLPGDDDAACDFIYALCLGRTPCIVQVRDHGVPPPMEWGDSATPGAINELYLRVCASQRAPFAAVQQVAIEAVRVPGGWVVTERPRAGVYDAPLLARMQTLVATLPAYGLEHLDFGDIAHAPPGFSPGAWTARFGGAPAIANYLFYAQPTTMVATTWIGDAAGRVGAVA